jgi:hypothetical protein
MAVPYVFANATSAIPLSNLDNNFSTPVTIGNVAIQLGNTATTLSNLSLANVTITSSSISNVTVGSTANAVVYANTTNILSTNANLKFDGTNVQVANSLTSANTFGFKNRIINGGMVIAQRGTSFTNVSLFQYTLDRYKALISYTGGTTNVTQQSDSPDYASKYSIRYTQATANTSAITTYVNRQSIETANIVDFAGQSVTLSFWYKSSKTGSHVAVVAPVGTTGGSTVTTAFTVVSANVWQYITITVTSFVSVTAWGSDNAEGAFVDVGFTENGTGQTSVNSGDYFAIARLQLEVGTQATTFDFRDIGRELILCQRYFEKSYDQGTAPATNTPTGTFNFSGSSEGNGNVIVPIQYLTKRTAPTLTGYLAAGTAGSWNWEKNGGSGTGSITFDRTSDRESRAYIVLGTNWVVGYIYGQWTASAEL